MAKREEPFHGPFKKLKGLKVRKKEERQSPAKPVPKPRPEPDDEELFQHAMKGVRPMSNDSITPEPADPKALLARSRKACDGSDQEVVDALYGLVKERTGSMSPAPASISKGTLIPMDPATMKSSRKASSPSSPTSISTGTRSRPPRLRSYPSSSIPCHGTSSCFVIHGRGLKSSQALSSKSIS